MDVKSLNSEFSKDLLEKRIIYLEDGIDLQTAKIISKKIIWLNVKNPKEEITLIIDSSGGGFLGGLNIYDAAKNSKSPIIGVIYRRATSMAALILQACVKRKALKNSFLGFHNLVLTLDGEWPEIVKNFKEDLSYIKKRQKDYNQIIASRSGLSMKRVQELCDQRMELSAQEALDLGLIDEII